MTGRLFPLLCAAVLLVVLAAPAGAAEPASGTITPDSGPVAWDGAFTIVGGNISNFLGSQTCEGDVGGAPVVHACDVFELTVDVPAGYWDTHQGGVKIAVRWQNGDNDFDLYVFKKLADGKLVLVGSSAQGPPTTSEQVILFKPEGKYLVRVNPFLVLAEGFEGTAEWLPLDAAPVIRANPDRVMPVKASNGPYLSYSEPHIAINPLDPNNLVAGSKMYQNLEEYLFKIGTFVSFDGGRTWTDNGHLPGYPVQTGSEGDAYYITSDVWMAFDDEGNAYTMVLDTDDTTDSATGFGWGMSLHKSADGGRTWSTRSEIHWNDDPASNVLFLDDKNTMAIDNYGPNLDSRTGNMYACWSFDSALLTQEIAFTRSTDGGAIWSQPVPISGTENRVIGCHVVVGPPLTAGDPGVVYVFWLDYAGDRIRFVKSTDGGQTFSLPRTVSAVNEIPRQFPNSAFRNLSIPWADVDPGTGKVYVSWADYHATLDAPCPPDPNTPPGQVCDADILLASSADGGTTWSAPVRVNQDAVGNGKDQFQQALAITPSGQLNMMWFDRRNDRQNFYIDTFFARSNDGGQTWREVRVTHSMWDPSVNPPISGSGAFIGDYQGIVATDEVAIPFWQDTTLANLDVTDPAHSPYQQAFSARVVNTKKLGGPR